MPTDNATSGLISYREAAALLGRQEQSIRRLVLQGHLHAVAIDPQDKRRRLLSRAEVEAYAIKNVRRALTPRSSELDISPQLIGAVAGGIVLLLLLLVVFDSAANPTQKALVMGAIVGIALLVIAEWSEQGRISTQEARRLERLAQKASADPAQAEPFMTELQKVIEASGASA